MIGNWIYEENLKPLLEVLSQLVSYNFDDSDWTAISTGLKGTDDEKNEWYSYSLIGRKTVEVEVAADNGSCVVHVRLHSELHVEEKAEVAISIFQNYTVR